MRAYAIIYEPILPVAPGAEDHPGFGLLLMTRVCPPRRNDDFVSWFGHDGNAAPGPVKRRLLRIDDGVALPNLEKFRSRPSTVGSDGMHMSLAANRFIAQPAFFICHYPEKQHSLPQCLSMFIPPNIHGDAIDRIGAVADGDSRL